MRDIHSKGRIQSLHIFQFLKDGGLFVLCFLLVIVFFTSINLYEFVFDREPDGHIKGLERLELSEDHAVNAWGALQKLMGKKVANGSTVYEDVTLLKNGAVTMADHYPDVSPAKEAVTDAEEFASSISADFLYVQAPGKEETPLDLPYGAVSYGPAKAEEMTAFVRREGIENISIKELLTSDGEDWYSYFYRTDHHMRNRAAYLTAGAVLEKINGENTLSEDGFEKITYKDIFLGTQGRMTGRYYAGLDDYELWLPKEEGHYSLEVPSEGIYREGTFKEAFLYEENLSHYSFDWYAYYAYLHQDYKHMILKNEDKPEGKRAVIIRDSTAVPVSVFMITECGRIDLIDLRYTDASEDVYGLIEDISPDIIIYMFGPGYLGVKSAVQLH